MPQGGYECSLPSLIRIITRSIILIPTGSRSRAEATRRVLKISIAKDIHLDQLLSISHLSLHQKLFFLKLNDGVDDNVR
jgi:hypothetical protein